MKVYINNLLFVIVLFGSKLSNAQAQYIDTNYKYTYKLKLQGVYSPGEAKIAKSILIGIFDSRHQSYSIADSTITIRSAHNNTESVFREKIQNNGYQVLFFSKSTDPAPINETKKEN